MDTTRKTSRLSRAAGIEHQRIAQLRQSALAHAREIMGRSADRTAGFRFISLAHQRMAVLVEGEILAANPAEAAPWLTLQAHLVLAAMLVADWLREAARVVRSACGRATADCRLAACC